MKLDDDILLSHDGLSADALFRKAPAEPADAPCNSQTLPYGRLLKPTETTDLPLTSDVGLATDTNEGYRGLFVCNEGPTGWNIRNYDRVYEIKRTADLAALSLRISDGQTRWKRNEIKFGFGLIPVPVRNDSKDFHGYYRVDVDNNRTAYEPNIVSPSGEKSSFIQNLAWNGVKIALAHECWTDFESYWVESRGEDVRMPKYVAAAKSNGIKTIAYFGFQISNMIPEFPLYHDLFLSKPNPYPDGGYCPYVVQGAGIGDPEQEAYTVCYASEFGDLFARGIVWAVRHYDWNGVYFDGGLGQVPACVNVKHGCGTVDPYGRLVYTFPVRRYRRLMEYVYNEGLKKDPEFIIDNHVETWPQPYLMGLMTAYHTGEASIFFEGMSRTEPGALRGWMNGKLYGVPCEMVRRPETPWETAWAQGLLVDAYPRLISLDGTYNQKMWGLYDRYHLSSDTFTPYFNKKNRVLKDNSNVFVSYYDTDKALVVVVSNYWSEKPQSVTLDLSAFKGLSAKCRDAWNNVDLELANGKATMTIDPMRLRLLVIEKN